MPELILEIFQYLSACPFSAATSFWLVIGFYLLLGFRKENFILTCLSSISICQAAIVSIISDPFMFYFETINCCVNYASNSEKSSFKSASNSEKSLVWFVQNNLTCSRKKITLPFNIFQFHFPKKQSSSCKMTTYVKFANSYKSVSEGSNFRKSNCKS